MAAWLPFDAGRHVEALAAFEALAARGARTSRAAQVRWFVGWNNYRLGRFVEAAAQFAQLGAEFPEVRDKALYWQARSAERAGQQEAARLYARLVRDAPLDWYGVLARTRSGASLPAPPPPAAPPLRTTPTSHVRLRRAERLLSAGLAQAAVWEIDAVPSSARRRRPSGEVLADLYARAGAPRAALRAAAQHLGTRLSSPPVAADVALARHLYPRAFADVVRDRAAATRLPAVLVWGLMRQESEFEPDARSHAGAIGLLQVMAPTAARTAALREEPPPSEEELATPAVNVALGTHYLRALIDKFAGQVVPALAAYNGGPPNVTKWLEREGTLPLDEFVEEIPFLESREYVKKVLGNSVVFGWLYGEDPWLDGALALRWRLDTKVAPQPDF
jgi:soluble lytic murein transglycosylase